MFGPQVLPAADRKPKSVWVLRDNKWTGICADKDYENSFVGLILPYGLTQEQTDLILWAFERGLDRGKDQGREALQVELRQLLSAERA